MKAGDHIWNARLITIPEIEKYCVVLETSTPEGSEIVTLHGDETMKDLDLNFVEVSQVSAFYRDNQTGEVHLEFCRGWETLEWIMEDVKVVPGTDSYIEELH